MTLPDLATQPTDWPALIARLERRMKQIEIEHYCGYGDGWVSRLKRGKISEPGHRAGEILKALDAYYAQRECVTVAFNPAIVLTPEDIPGA